MSSGDCSYQVPELDQRRIGEYARLLRSRGVAQMRAEHLAHEKAKRKRWYTGRMLNCGGY